MTPQPVGRIRFMDRQRVIEPVGDVGLIARRAPGPQLGHGNDQLGRPEHGQHPGQLGRGGAGAQPDDLVPRYRRVDQQAGERHVGQRHRLVRDGQVQAVPGDEGVD